MSAKQPVLPHEKRVLRYGYTALAAATVLGAALILTTDARLLGADVPVAVPFSPLAVGAVVGVVAVARRSGPIALAAVAFLALAVLPASSLRPAVSTYALGVLFGLALLLTFELVHMTARYERAHRAVEQDNVPEDHINRVTDEALRTLAGRSALAAAGVALVVALAYLLAAVGPAQWRAAVETTAPLGVAVLGLAVAGALSLFILARGAKLRLAREPKPKELLPDVAE